MNLSGSLAIAAPPMRVLKKLSDPAIWSTLLPHCRGVTETAPGALVAKMEYMAGPLPIRSDARIQITETDARARQIRIEGGSFVTGHATLVLDVTATRSETGSTFAYTGTLISSGVIKRMLAGKEEGLGRKAEALFGRYKTRLEKSGEMQKTA